MQSARERAPRDPASRERYFKAKHREQLERAADEALLSLNTLLQALAGAALTVELRNDRVVSGKLEEADAYMNLSLSNVEVRDGDSSERLPAFYIKGQSIRYVHLPADVDAAGLLRSRVPPHKRKHARRRPTRRRRRAPPPPPPPSRISPPPSAPGSCGASTKAAPLSASACSRRWRSGPPRSTRRSSAAT